MPKIRIRDGKKILDILIDQDDVERVLSYVWTIENGRAVTKIAGKTVSIHRFIMNAIRGDNILIDHIDGDSKNNRKENLRQANRFQNQQNRKTNEGNTLPKGIRLLPSGMYNVRVQAYNRRIGIGTFPSLEEAIEARNEAARKLHGEFFRESYDLAEKNE